jgi:TetR/AcrR family transcriptional regulator
MPEPESRRGRVHDAEGAREAILNAAEAIFAEHGFDGARIDTIAAASGYNKSLLFHYFDDKLGLYAAVIRRTDKELDELQEQVVTSLQQMIASLHDEATLSVHEFSTMLKTVIGAFFDYLVEHPRLVRILLWEMAEGWQTYTKIMSQKDREDVNRVMSIFHKLQRDGLLRSSVDPVVQLVIAIFSCHYYLSVLPMLQMLLPDQDISSTAALARAKEFVIEFVTRGLIVDPAEHA